MYSAVSIRAGEMQYILFSAAERDAAFTVYCVGELLRCSHVDDNDRLFIE